MPDAPPEDQLFPRFAAQQVATAVGEELVRLVLTGGFPEMLRRSDEERCQAWARDYLNTLLRRDEDNIAEVEKGEAMTRLFRMLGHHSAQLVNFWQMAAQGGPG